MYEQYWELHRRPFDGNADPEFFYESRSHRAARLRLQYVLESGHGAGLLVGGVGYGKTTLIRQIAGRLPEPFSPVIHVLFPRMNSRELLAYLAVELGADSLTFGSAESNLDRVVRQIESLLAHHAELGRCPTIIIDDAQLIDDPQVLEALQLLLNFQQRAPIRFNLFLVGDWSLLGNVQRIAQLDERLGVRSSLQPLNADETAEYVRRRLQVAGADREIFDDSAMRALFELSGGVPRKINQLGDLSLLIGCADALTTLSAEQIEAVAEELTLVVLD